MGRKLMLVVLVLLTMVAAGCTEEAEESLDDNNDIIVRNYTSDTLWIKVDGLERGHIDDTGLAENVWDGAPDGSHILSAYYDSSYTNLYCTVTTDYLDDGEDFFWYLEHDGDYSGTKEGHCH